MRDGKDRFWLNTEHLAVLVTLLVKTIGSPTVWASVEALKGTWYLSSCATGVTEGVGTFCHSCVFGEG